MTTLHLVNKSPFERNAMQSCLEHALAGDGIIMFEDGVYGAVKGSAIAGLVESKVASVKVYVLNNYGAMTVGEHRFFKLTPGKPDEQTETGRFIIVWKLEAGAWKMARVVSYDHHLTH